MAIVVVQVLAARRRRGLRSDRPKRSAQSAHRAMRRARPEARGRFRNCLGVARPDRAAGTARPGRAPGRARPDRAAGRAPRGRVPPAARAPVQEVRRAPFARTSQIELAKTSAAFEAWDAARHRASDRRQAALYRRARIPLRRSPFPALGPIIPKAATHSLCHRVCATPALRPHTSARSAGIGPLGNANCPAHRHCVPQACRLELPRANRSAAKGSIETGSGASARRPAMSQPVTGARATPSWPCPVASTRLPSCCGRPRYGR